MSDLHSEIKKEFQLERMILFTDAVFAIAITLLIIEIKAPEIHHGMSRIEKINQLLELTGKFIAFMVSFILIGIYWIAHHRLFGFVKDYNNRLLWLNLFFLFTIVVMPFSSAYYSENFGEHIPFAFYCFNVIGTGIANFLLANYLIRHRKKLTVGFDNKELHGFTRSRILVVPVVFIFCFILSIFIPVGIACYAPMMIFPAMKFIRWRYKNAPIPA